MVKGLKGLIRFVHRGVTWCQCVWETDFAPTERVGREEVGGVDGGMRGGGWGG